jgi:hypothetical protein
MLEQLVRKNQLEAIVNDLLANNGILGHDRKVSTGDDVPVTSCGNEDVGAVSSILHGGDLVTGHGSLESVDGVDFGDEDASTVRFEGLGALGIIISQETNFFWEFYSLLCRHLRNQQRRRPCQQA